MLVVTQILRMGQTPVAVVVAVGQAQLALI
jgi:hypothetical protein